MQKKNIVILGATGSIGKSTLDVISANAERFELKVHFAKRMHDIGMLPLYYGDDNPLKDPDRNYEGDAKNFDRASNNGLSHSLQQLVKGFEARYWSNQPIFSDEMQLRNYLMASIKYKRDLITWYGKYPDHAPPTQAVNVDMNATRALLEMFLKKFF